MAEKSDTKHSEVPAEKAEARPAKGAPAKTDSKAAPADAKEGKKVLKKKAKRRNVQQGKAFVQASYNNTIITLTDDMGNVLAWSSSGSNGFKGARKSTPYAAQVSAENAVEKAKVYGLERVHVYINGVGSGREQSVRGLISRGLDLLSITDVTPAPHNGCRKRKARRI